MKKHHYLLLALIVGALSGSIAHFYQDHFFVQMMRDYFFAPIGQIFLRLVFMVIVPMIFTGLFLGVYQLSHHHGLGRVLTNTLLFTLISSIASVVIGITLVSVMQPGKNAVDPNVLAQHGYSDQIATISKNAADTKSFTDILVQMVPKNPLESAVKAFDGEILSLMIFALIFGIAYSLVQRKKAAQKNDTFVVWCEQVYETCLMIVEVVMKSAPLAVFSLIFISTCKFGPGIITSLGSYVLVVVLALLIQQFGVYALLLKTFTKWSPWDFFKKCRDVYLYAFATASSNATLPTALNTAEHQLKFNPAISRFVLTIGSTANQNGTALFEGVTVLFLAQVFAIDLTLVQQFLIVVMSVIAGIGTAGVPGGSLPLIMILLGQVGIPPEAIGLILGVDRFLDMCRTTINVSGDLVITALVDSMHKGNSKT